MTRIERLAALLEEPLLVAGPPYVLGGQANVRYLTGLASSNAAVLVEPDATATIFTDFRYASRAREVDGAELVETARLLLPAIGAHLAGAQDRVRGAAPAVRGIPGARGGRGRRAVPTRRLVESLRAVKDADEIASMRRAGALSDDVFAALAEERFSGRTERELVWWVERSFREAGAEGVSFPTVVAAGETGTSPHAVPGDDPIERGVLVTIDAGCVVDGYCSDCTRTFAVGAVPSGSRSSTRSASRRSSPASRPSRPACTAGTPTRRRGADRRRRAGRGVRPRARARRGPPDPRGPVLRPESTDVLEAGNVVSVEPGIYVPGEGGVRIEDLVLVTDDGRERLTQFSKELLTVE